MSVHGLPLLFQRSRAIQGSSARACGSLLTRRTQ